LKLAVFYPENITCAWSLQIGLCDVLERMGHQVTRCGITDRLKRPADLNAYDALIVSGPEHIGKHLVAQPDWKDCKVPRIGWLHESVRREDYGKLDVDAIKRTCDQVYCPAQEDEEFGFKYLPFGVDTAIFHPSYCVGCTMEQNNHALKGEHTCQRDIDLAFIGMVYPKREAYLKTLPESFRKRLLIGNCLVQDLHGVNIRKSVELYAETLRRIKVFFMLPALSRLTVTKIYEAAACGAFISESVEEAEFFLSDSFLAKAKINKLTTDRASAVQSEHSLENRIETLLSSVQVAA